jgi:hypothetical protein
MSSEGVMDSEERIRVSGALRNEASFDGHVIRATYFLSISLSDLCCISHPLKTRHDRLRSGKLCEDAR